MVTDLKPVTTTWGGLSLLSDHFQQKFNNSRNRSLPRSPFFFLFSPLRLRLLPKIAIIVLHWLAVMLVE